MLAEDRCKKILDILDSMGSVTVQQLMDELDTSESTIRRDLVALDKKKSELSSDLPPALAKCG